MGGSGLDGAQCGCALSEYGARSCWCWQLPQCCTCCPHRHCLPSCSLLDCSPPRYPALLLPARLLTSPLPCLPGCSPRGDDLDTRLLRAMVVKGMLEQITTSQVGAAGRPDCWVPSAGCRVLGAAGRAVLGLPALTRAEGLELRAACLGHGPPPQSAPGHCLPPSHLPPLCCPHLTVPSLIWPPPPPPACRSTW